MWAEWRHATDARTPPSGEERWVCTFAAELSVLDLRDAATRRSVGVEIADLLAPWAPGAPNRAARDVIASAWEMGADAVIVPSAAREGGWNLVVRPEAFGTLRQLRRRRTTPPA